MPNRNSIKSKYIPKNQNSMRITYTYSIMGPSLLTYGRQHECDRALIFTAYGALLQSTPLMYMMTSESFLSVGRKERGEEGVVAIICRAGKPESLEIQNPPTSLRVVSNASQFSRPGVRCRTSILLPLLRSEDNRIHAQLPRWSPTDP